MLLGVPVKIKLHDDLFLSCCLLLAAHLLSPEHNDDDPFPALGIYIPHCRDPWLRLNVHWPTFIRTLDWTSKLRMFDTCEWFNSRWEGHNIIRHLEVLLIGITAINCTKTTSQWSVVWGHKVFKRRLLGRLLKRINRFLRLHENERVNSNQNVCIIGYWYC